jgi:hypothetical protein
LTFLINIVLFLTERGGPAMCHSINASSKNVRRALIFAHLRTAQYDCQSDQKRLERELRAEQDTTLRRVIVRFINPCYTWQTLCVFAIHSDSERIARDAFGRLSDILDFENRRLAYQLIAESGHHPAIRAAAAEKLLALAN